MRVARLAGQPFRAASGNRRSASRITRVARHPLLDGANVEDHALARTHPNPSGCRSQIESGSSANLVQRRQGPVRQNIHYKKCFKLAVQWHLPRAIRNPSCPIRRCWSWIASNESETSLYSMCAHGSSHVVLSAANHLRRGIVVISGRFRICPGKVCRFASG